MVLMLPTLWGELSACGLNISVLQQTTRQHLVYAEAWSSIQLILGTAI